MEIDKYKSAQIIMLPGDDEKHKHVIFENKREAADYFYNILKNTAKGR